MVLIRNRKGLPFLFAKKDKRGLKMEPFVLNNSHIFQLKAGIKSFPRLVAGITTKMAVTAKGISKT